MMKDPWPSGATADVANPPTLQKLYEAHQGKLSDKWSLYLAEYTRLFADWRAAPVRLLEIGTQNGGSLELWPAFFPNAERIVGCDVDPLCGHLRFADARVQLVIGDANADDTQARLRELSAQFDIVIDDGSHRSGDIIQTFVRYFPQVVEGGLFVIEDLHCSYWKEFEGGLYEPRSSIAFFKRLVDVVNFEHWGVANPLTEPLQDFFDAYGCEIAPQVLQQVRSVEFLNSLCVIRKGCADGNVLGPRVIAGMVELVARGHRGLQETRAVPLDQSGNPMSAAGAAPEHALGQLRAALRGREADVDRLQQALRESPSQALAPQIDLQQHELRRVMVEQQLQAMAEQVGERDRRIGVLADSVAEQAAHVVALQQDLAQRELEIARRDEAIALRDKEIARRDVDLAQRDSDLAMKDRMLADRDLTAQGLARMLAGRERRLDEAAAVIAARELTIGDLHRVLADRLADVAHLTDTVAARERCIEQLERSLADQTARTEGLEIALDQERHRAADLGDALSRCTGKRDELVQAVAKRNQQIAAVNRALTELVNRTWWQRVFGSAR